MEQKTKQIEDLLDYLFKKHGSADIILTDYWDGDPTAVGLTDKTKNYTVYITDNGNTNKLFFVSLENPAISADFPYTQGDEFSDITSAQVEEIVIKHLYHFRSFSLNRYPLANNQLYS